MNNQTFITGIILEQMKIALVSPIYKANENSKFDHAILRTY